MQIVRLDYIQDGEDDPAIKEYYVGQSFLGKMPSDERLDVFRGTLRCGEATEVFDWWLSLVKNGHSPKKSELLFREMAKFSHNLGLIVWKPDMTAQMRLAGSGIEDMVGCSMRGMDITKAAQFSTGMCELSWQSQVIERRIRYYRRDLRNFDKIYKDIGILELPVADGDGGRYKYLLSHIKAIDRR